MGNQLKWFVVAPALVVVGLVGAGWQSAAAQSRLAPAQLSSAKVEAPASVLPTPDEAQREYVLEVISLGVTLDRYRQGALWESLSKGHPGSSIREQDPKKYPWSADEKEGVEGGRSGDTLENGAKFTPMYWGVPSFYADSAATDPRGRGKPEGTVVGGLTAGAESSGMAWHLFVPADWELSERPDGLLGRVFSFFDKYPDLPYVVLSAADGMYFRDMYRPKGTPPLIKDANYVPEMPDASALFVLARRERVDAVRPFASDDADDELHPLGIKGPSRDFKPTPWFPIPWNKHQLEQVDRLPTLGYLHRPIFVPMFDKVGKPLTRRDERAAALAAGWQQALQTLPEAERKAAPARVIVATAGNADQTIALTRVLDDWTAQGGPEIDKSHPAQWIDTDARLGNTGAATWFMQMAVGVMGSYRDGGTSAAINLRDPAEASIVFISPPSEAKRKSQRHGADGDVFGHYATPAIDPDNYKQ